MKKLTLALMVAMAFVSFGCKKKAGSNTAASLAKMTEFKDEMCKCKDAKCAQDVSDRMTKWSQEQQKNQKETVKMSDEETKKAAEIGDQMSKCMTAATSAGSAEGSAAGSAEGSAAGSAEGSAGSAAAGSAEGSAAGSAAAGSAAGSAAAGSAAGSAAKGEKKDEKKKEEKKK